MPQLNIFGPNPERGIPEGMIMVDGEMSRGKAGWSYDGNNESGTLKMFWENHEVGTTGGMFSKATFINEDKILLLEPNGSVSIIVRVR